LPANNEQFYFCKIKHFKNEINFSDIFASKLIILKTKINRPSMPSVAKMELTKIEKESIFK
jgi:hypothetical protein